jgi:bifunctional DNA-binding transcriptional regulator/antitoxin component of YhaV-PrlF toxin-antitoxin module
MSDIRAKGRACHVGPKGRVVLPAAVREAAHVEVGDELFAHVDREGRIVMETARGIQARVWEAASGIGEFDATADIRALRDEDTRLADAAAERRSARGEGAASGDADAAGAALLAELGL